MSYIFTLKKGDLEIFTCYLKRYKCQDCSVITEYGFEYCPKHLLSRMHLVIGNSKKLPGEKALFASNGKRVSSNWRKNAIIFYGRKNTLLTSSKGDYIIDYNGETMSLTEMHERYGINIQDQEVSGPYCAKQNKCVVDSARVRGVGAFCNHQPKTKANAELYGTRKLKIAATKHIRNGTEIEITYGYDPLDLTKKGYTYSTVYQKIKNKK
jgi:hypothetical protein